MVNEPSAFELPRFDCICIFAERACPCTFSDIAADLILFALFHFCYRNVVIERRHCMKRYKIMMLSTVLIATILTGRLGKLHVYSF